MFKRMNLRMRMLLCILPTVALALIIVTVISTSKASSAIRTLTENRAQESLQGNINSINTTLETLRATATTLSNTVGATYTGTSLDSYEKIFSNTIQNNSVISGAGIWFASGIYNNEEYAGPYWYRDGDNIVYTDEYSNADYNYFSQEYYTNAAAMTSLDAVITDPYYDSASGTIMATCSAPIFNSEGTNIGCITVDTILTSIQDMVSTISLGTNSAPMLTDSTGIFLYDTDATKISDIINITADPNTTLAAASTDIMANESGITNYELNGQNYLLFYNTIPEVNWKLIVTLQEAEMNATVTSLRNYLVGVCFAGILICAVIILLLVNSIAKNIRAVKSFAGSLSNGDFTINKIQIKREDELGKMSESLNTMFESNRGLITKVSDESKRIGDTAMTLNNMADELTNEFQVIQSNMTGVNDAMMSTSAATEQVNASVEEVNASVQMLAGQADESKNQANDILARAHEVEENARKSHENALSVAAQREMDVANANSQADVVQQIGSLADSIAEIADQINLLSLNASIEAARAGEHGKGFAVVATEINKLASQTGETVSQIQQTVSGVQEVFSNLLAATNELVTFLKETVAPDYDNFVNVAQQYGDDANSIGDQSATISDMVETIRSAMSEVSSAIQNIAESSQETASHSADITDTVNSVSEVVENVTEMSGQSNTIAQNLSGVISKFKLH